MQSYHPEIKGTDSSSCCPEVLEQRRGEVRIDDFSRLVHDFQANLKNRLRLVEANIQTLFLILSQVFSIKITIFCDRNSEFDILELTDLVEPRTHHQILLT